MLNFPKYTFISNQQQFNRIDIQILIEDKENSDKLEEKRSNLHMEENKEKIDLIYEVVIDHKDKLQKDIFT